MCLVSAGVCRQPSASAQAAVLPRQELGRQGWQQPELDSGSRVELAHAPFLEASWGCMAAVDVFTWEWAVVIG